MDDYLRDVIADCRDGFKERENGKPAARYDSYSDDCIRRLIEALESAESKLEDCELDIKMAGEAMASLQAKLSDLQSDYDECYKSLIEETLRANEAESVLGTAEDALYNSEVARVTLAEERDSALLRLEQAESFPKEWHNPSDLLRINELESRLGMIQSNAERGASVKVEEYEDFDAGYRQAMRTVLTCFVVEKQSPKTCPHGEQFVACDQCDEEAEQSE